MMVSVIQSIHYSSSMENNELKKYEEGRNCSLIHSPNKKFHGFSESNQTQSLSR